MSEYLSDYERFGEVIEGRTVYADEPSDKGEAGGTRFVRPWSELRTSGLLWLINRVVFHPRGFALGLVVAEDGRPVGWDLIGDGAEPWSFGDGEAANLAAAEQTLAAQRRERSELPK